MFQMWYLSDFFVSFAISRNNLRFERNIWPQIWFMSIMINIILFYFRPNYAYRFEPDGYRIEIFGQKIKNFENWWIMRVLRKIKIFLLFQNTGIIHQISKFFIFAPKFLIRYPSGSNRYAYFQRSEHKIICIIMRRNQICVQIFRSVRKLFRKIAKNTKKTLRCHIWTIATKSAKSA